jgi:hypothetical protein
MQTASRTGCVGPGRLLTSVLAQLVWLLTWMSLLAAGSVHSGR